ncbi:DUF1566 domain-containing protein [Massilia sp. TSP1-1-2]|uniref:Lcl C-terminal domain-containing protein n=1 Tax=unclassified Massilia TaxID=2609279 RepID=UPI003CE9CD86
MYKQLRQRTLVLAALLAAIVPSAQAACNGADIVADTPDTRFTVATDTVLDKATGLTWKRCAEGLSGADCAAGAVLTGTWAEALARVATVNAASATLGAGANDWRLPNRNELATLVERKCTNPAINATVFSRTPAQSFWTGSPYALNAALAWYVDFNAGDVGPAFKTGAKNIRLVRGGN